MMQSFNFGIHRSGADSMDDTRSRYAPSSIYSGPGPAEDSTAPSTAAAFTPMTLQGPFQEEQAQYNPSHPRSSTLLNINDPVAMHLLMETAINDSRDFDILSFEEVEGLKKERTFLRSRVEATKRKIALESKLRDAAQSLNRLYSTHGRAPSGDMKTDGTGITPKSRRRSLLGSKSNNSHNEILVRADEEFAASNRKVDEFTRELAGLEKRLEDCQRRIVEHTAGILQMTHKGLKKNVKRTELPRSPESMASLTNRSGSRMDTMDDFDERSLYQVPDYVTDFGHIPAGLVNGKASKAESQEIEYMAMLLDQLSKRLHGMVLQSGTQEHFDAPPKADEKQKGMQLSNHIQAHIGYLTHGLNAMEAAQARNMAEAQKTIFDSEDQLEDVNVRLNAMLQRTNSVGKGPAPLLDEPRGRGIQSQLAFSSAVLDRLNQRVETLVEQKDILTRQIQQQRELNTKSDAQRDAQIRSLTDDLSESKRQQLTSEKDVKQTRDQIHLLMEQLDQAKQDSVLLEQQRGISESKAVQAERDARHESEEKLMADLKTKQDLHTQLQADMSKMKHEFDTKLQHNLQQLNDLTVAKEQLEIEKNKSRSEMDGLESEVVRVQTELTFVKAELDGAYGTRAQRAADASKNPAVQKEIDDLQSKANGLQKELKETIEDYEVMTKQNIEAEKARDQLEEKIDVLEHRCEALETQISEEKLKWLGVKPGSPSETTSTMVLKNEFKKMMRETRADNVKAIKAEQDERRRLESIIRGLKKDSRSNTPSKASARPPNGTLAAQ